MLPDPRVNYKYDGTEGGKESKFFIAFSGFHGNMAGWRSRIYTTQLQ